MPNSLLATDSAMRRGARRGRRSVTIVAEVPTQTRSRRPRACRKRRTSIEHVGALAAAIDVQLVHDQERELARRRGATSVRSAGRISMYSSIT